MPHLGSYTKTDLRDTGWFSKANQGHLTLASARFGLELAQLAYDFEIAPWLNAGWTDVSIQVDQRLIGGLSAASGDLKLMQQAKNLLLPKLAKSLTSVSNPVSEIRGYLKQYKEHETGKAIVLMRKEDDGTFTIAIGFMGTGKRPQDWAGNMRFKHEDNFHEGFSAIAAQFENNAQSIFFPTAAEQLGLEQLSLLDVLTACKRADSPFRLVLAGHSQGAAVMQVWTYRRLMDGVLPAHLYGSGFASPVVAINLPKDEHLCPLTHYLISDDIFTRVGLQDHLGTCYTYTPDDAFRAVCYGKELNNPLFQKTLAVFSKLQNTQSALLFAQGFLAALAQRPHKAIGSSLAVFVESSLAESLAELPVLTEEWTQRLMRLTQRGFRFFYADAIGQPADKDEVLRVRDEIALLMDEFGAVAVSQMLVKALHLTHALVGKEEGLEDHAPYSYLVVRAFDQLVKQEEPQEQSAPPSP